jgi:hypothetical protein
MSAHSKSVDEIAYELWVARGRAHGSALQDWVDAERQVAARRATDQPAAWATKDQGAAAKVPKQAKIPKPAKTIKEPDAVQQRKPLGKPAGRSKSPDRKPLPRRTPAKPGNNSEDDG